tara:strand:+ start:1 stop:1287 length:1287 start_codon:yes stop_codon:yes gene_type:complete
MTYLGAFVIDHTDGVSTTDYNMGRLGFRPPDGSTNGSFGSVYTDSIYGAAVAEFEIPALSTSTDRTALPKATNIQNFKELDDIYTDNNGRDRIGYIGYADGKLYVATYKNYDNSSSAENVAIFDNAANLQAGGRGAIEVVGRDSTVNYFAPIPAEWQSALGGTHLVGSGGGMSISSRTSYGPALFAFTPADVGPTDTTISTVKHMQFPHDKGDGQPGALATDIYPRPVDWEENNVHPEWDQYNESVTRHYLNQLGFATYEEWRTSSPRTEWSTLTPPDPSIVNDLWVNNSHGVCHPEIGFIVPGTSTFLAIGRMSGRRYGIGYKEIGFQGGNADNGGAPLDRTDRDNWFWAFDLNEVVAAPNSYSTQPYDYGVFQNNRWADYMFDDVNGMVSGGAYDPDNDRLYVAQKYEGGGVIEIVVSVYSLGVQS